jgi:GT2 family glycosyltransferase
MDVQWIPGCSMFYKREVFDKFRFNATMENGPGKNYALGEDLDFSHRVSKVFSLKSVGDLSIVHHQAPSKRDNWLLIARASGAQYSYLLRAFPAEFNPIKIHLGRFLDFAVMNRPLTSNSLSSVLGQFSGYLKEFRRENQERLINLDQQTML